VDVGKQALIHQLVSVRAAVDAALVLLMAEMELPEQPQGCKHKNKLKLTTFDSNVDQFVCGDCDYEWEEPFKEEVE